MQQPSDAAVDVAELEYQDKLQGMCMLQRAVCWALAHLTNNQVILKQPELHISQFMQSNIH